MEALSAIHCEICDSGLNENKLLLCDRCDKGFHLYCLQPKLNSLPTGNWFCHGCSLIKLASLNRLNKTSSSSFNQSKNDNLSTTNHSPTSPAINGSQSNYSPSDTTSNVVTSSSSSSMNQQHRKRPQSPQLNSNQSNMKLCSHKDLVLVSESTILDQTANLNQSISVRPSMNQISTSLNDDDAINTDPGISSSSTQNVTATIDEASDNSDGNSESDSDSDSDLQSIDDVPTLNSPISKAPSSSQATESQEDTIRRVVLTAVTTTGIPRAMYSALPETHPAHFSTDIFLTYIRKLGVSVTEQSKPIIFSILMYLLEVVDENIKSVEGTEGQLPDEKLLLGIMECDQNVGIDSIQVFVDGYDKDSIVSKIRLVDGYVYLFYMI